MRYATRRREMVSCIPNVGGGGRCMILHHRLVVPSQRSRGGWQRQLACPSKTLSCRCCNSQSEGQQEFGRRVVLGTSAALAIGIGGNIGGIGSFLLGLNPPLFRSLKLDVLYPIRGFKRCVEDDFEFMYPATWVGDQRLLYRVAERIEKKYSGDFASDSIKSRKENGYTRSPIEPAVAFGPPGSNGEINVSVIEAPVPSLFRLEMIGDPKQVGEAILKNFVAYRNPNIIINILKAEKYIRPVNGEEVPYYTLEFTVEGQSFLRHNVAVYVVHNGRLFSMNAQTSEDLWSDLREQFMEMVSSFKVRQ